MVLAAVAILNVTDPDHQVYQVLNREDLVVKHRVLRVNSFNKGPEFVDHFYVLRVDPEVTAEEQALEKLFLQ